MAIKINGVTVIDDSRVGNLAAATAVGNVQAGNVLTTGLISATGNITGNFLLGNGSQLTGIDATSIQNGTANVRTFLNGNVTVSAAGTANVLTVTSTGANISGTLNTGTGNANVGNLGATNVVATNLTGTLLTAAQTNITSVGTLSSLSVSGNVQGGNLRTAGLISATGTITGGGITLNGNTISSSGSTLTIDPSTAGIEGNVVIAGNLSVQGNVTYIDSTTVTTNEKDIVLANNVNTTAAVNGAGILLGNNSVVTWTYNNTSNAWVSNVGVSAVGNITGGNLSGTGITGTLLTAAQTNITSLGTLTSLNSGAISSSGNVTGANILTGGIVSATGNITGGNIAGTRGAFTNIAGTLETAAQTNITSVGTLSSLSVSGNVQGGNLRTAGLVSATGSITGAAITGSSLTVSTGSVTCGNIVNANANGVGNIGSSSLYFNTVFAKATSAQYADLAEMYESDQILEPGTVVCFGGTKEITVCDQDSSARVAGVVSTNPSYIMNAGLQGDNVTAVALTGRVPTRVTGTVRKGDMMVSAGSGRARAESDPRIGTVIGKALADFDGAEGVIEVVIGRL